jgi:alcohol dehydrogenase
MPHKHHNKHHQQQQNNNNNNNTPSPTNGENNHTPEKLNQKQHGENNPLSTPEHEQLEQQQPVTVNNNQKTITDNSHNINHYSKLQMISYLVIIMALLPQAIQNLVQKTIHPLQVWMNEPLPGYEFMNASIFTHSGSPAREVLHQALVPKPRRRSGKNQLLVKVHKASLNPVDYKFRKNARSFTFPLPMITGKDVAGVVVESDEGSKFKIGDRVMAVLPPFPSKWGTFADYVVLDEIMTAPIPSSLSFSEAAALPLVGLTAHQALGLIKSIPVVTSRGVEKKPTLLVTAGSGGVGHVLIQLAKRLNFEVWTTSTNEEFCKKLGADVVVNYKTNRLQDVVPHNEFFDVIIDTIGGSTIWGQNQPLLKQTSEAVYVNILNSGMVDTFWHLEEAVVMELPVMLWYKLKHLFGYPAYYLAVIRSDGEELAYLGELVASKQLQIEIEQEFKGYDSVAEMHEVLEKGRTKGKLTIGF